jgi:hypothetical protein
MRAQIKCVSPSINVFGITRSIWFKFGSANHHFQAPEVTDFDWHWSDITPTLHKDHALRNFIRTFYLLQKKVDRCVTFVVSYGCETWSLTLKEEHRLRVFENRVLRGIFGPKGDEVTGEWRNLHSGELRNLYSSEDIMGQII